MRVEIMRSRGMLQISYTLIQSVFKQIDSTDNRSIQMYLRRLVPCNSKA